jgi:hypothetical protein
MRRLYVSSYPWTSHCIYTGGMNLAEWSECLTAKNVKNATAPGFDPASSDTELNNSQKKSRKISPLRIPAVKYSGEYSEQCKIYCCGRSGNKFRRSQIRKFTEINNSLDLWTFRKCGTLRIYDLWTQSFCDLRS